MIYVSKIYVNVNLGRLKVSPLPLYKIIILQRRRMKRNILTNTVDFIRLLKGKTGIKRKINIIPNPKFVHLKKEGINSQKSYLKLAHIPAHPRFQRRKCNVGGNLPVPRHCRF